MISDKMNRLPETAVEINVKGCTINFPITVGILHEKYMFNLHKLIWMFSYSIRYFSKNTKMSFKQFLV